MDYSTKLPAYQARRKIFSNLNFPYDRILIKTGLMWAFVARNEPERNESRTLSSAESIQTHTRWRWWWKTGKWNVKNLPYMLSWGFWREESDFSSSPRRLLINIFIFPESEIGLPGKKKLALERFSETSNNNYFLDLGFLNPFWKLQFGSCLCRNINNFFLILRTNFWNEFGVFRK